MNISETGWSSAQLSPFPSCLSSVDSGGKIIQWSRKEKSNSRTDSSKIDKAVFNNNRDWMMQVVQLSHLFFSSIDSCSTWILRYFKSLFWRFSHLRRAASFYSSMKYSFYFSLSSSDVNWDASLLLLDWSSSLPSARSSSPHVRPRNLFTSFNERLLNNETLLFYELSVHNLLDLLWRIIFRIRTASKKMQLLEEFRLVCISQYDIFIYIYIYISSWNWFVIIQRIYFAYQ